MLYNLIILLNDNILLSIENSYQLLYQIKSDIFKNTHINDPMTLIKNFIDL